MKEVYIGKVSVSPESPRVIVPIVARDTAGILKKAEELKNYTMDVVEWRADFYEEVFDTSRVIETAAALKKVLGDTPVLFTFRTEKEGGEKAISPEQYTELIKAAAESGYIDAVDVEIFSGDDIVSRIIENVHRAGITVIGSNHDFNGTPSEEELIRRLIKMQEMGADIPKIAVMPVCREDVLTLLSATQKMADHYADRPIITMSMGSMGVISRIAGEAFGSSMTFGAVGEVSAPGQIPVKQLQQAIEILHNGICGR